MVLLKVIFLFWALPKGLLGMIFVIVFGLLKQLQGFKWFYMLVWIVDFLGYSTVFNLFSGYFDCVFSMVVNQRAAFLGENNQFLLFSWLLVIFHMAPTTFSVSVRLVGFRGYLLRRYLEPFGALGFVKQVGF